MNSMVTHRTMVWLATISFAAAALPPPAGATEDAKPALHNIAKGAPYTLSPRPNYRHCTDAGDRVQLTDGTVTEGYFWTQPGTVGWRSTGHAIITVDLKKIQPIAGVSLRSAAGAAGVCWPVAVLIHVSDDGKAFHEAGDLLAMDQATVAALPDGYSVRRFATSAMRTRGRYVRFLVLGAGPYIFVDEVEVFRGPDSFLKIAPTGEPVKSPKAYLAERRVRSRVRRRIETDEMRIAEAIRKATLPTETKERLAKRLAEARRAVDEADLPSDCDARIVLPLNEAHAAMFGVQGALWKASGRPALSAWTVPQWDPLDPFAAPPSETSSAMAVHTMRGEYRSAAFNLANTTDGPLRVRVSFKGLPRGSTPDYIAAHSAEWTDTVSGRAIATALPEVERADGAWSVTVHPGLVRQVWMTFHVPQTMPAGSHTGTVVASADNGEEASLPLQLRVYPMTFPKTTTLWLGGWSYTNGAGHRGVTLENRTALVNHLRSRFVNAPWATSAVMMKYEFTQEEPPTAKLDTAQFDDWIGQWPDAKAYLVFLSVGKTFAGHKMNTEAFNQRVGIWISAWVRHLGTKGISPEHLGLLLVDEPHGHAQDDIIIAWANAIRAAEPRVLIWEDPTYRDPTQARPALFEVSHVLCPNRPMWLSQGERFGAFYLAQQNKGRTLQLYSCSGPSTALDPYAYYRLQAWHCWAIGATGSFFWAFGDNSRSSSWNEYCAVRGPYTPEFLDAQSVTAAKQMEAIRESVEDYEYFVMLRAAVKRARAAGRTGQALHQAESLLKNAAQEVLGARGAKSLSWHEAKDRTQADRVRIRILETLMQLNGEA